MTTTNETTNDKQAGTTHAEYSNNGWGGRGSLADLVKELQRQKESKIDFVADTRELEFWNVKPGDFRLRPRAGAKSVREFFEGDGFTLTDSAFGQLCEKAYPLIPVRYGRKLLEQNSIACRELANMTFADRQTRRLFRCLDGKVRAILSDSYRFVDHFDLAFTALEVVQERGGEVLEATLDDHRMRLKFTTRQIWEVLEATRTGGDKSQWYAGGLGSQDWLSKVAARSGGDLPGGPGTVHPSVVLSNSETGHGGINVRMGILQGVCFNLATVETIVSDIHLGGKLEAGIFSEETRAADSKAIFLKARDAIKAAFEPEKFKALVAKLREAESVAIAAPTSAVSLVAERLELTEERRDSLLAHFLQDYKPTALGLASAVTRLSQEIEEPETAELFESFAGELLRSPKKTLEACLT